MESLRQVLAADYRGPKAVFGEVHVVKAIMAIGGRGGVGRGRLGALTGLGQGEVRTLIKRMKDKQLITIASSGCKLSKKGEEEYRMLSRLLIWSSSVKAGPLSIGEKSWAILVRNASKRVRLGIEQRDTAIKAGAGGAFTAVFSSGRFIVPGERTDCEKGFGPEPWRSVREGGPRDGDAVVVAGATNEEDAENGALAAAISLL